MAPSIANEIASPRPISPQHERGLRDPAEFPHSLQASARAREPSQDMPTPSRGARHPAARNKTAFFSPAAWYNVQTHFFWGIANDTRRTGPTWAQWIFCLQGL